jgi:hypothetical protein
VSDIYFPIFFNFLEDQIGDEEAAENEKKRYAIVTHCTKKIDMQKIADIKLISTILNMIHYNKCGGDKTQAIQSWEKNFVRRDIVIGHRHLAIFVGLKNTLASKHISRNLHKTVTFVLNAVVFQTRIASVLIQKGKKVKNCNHQTSTSVPRQFRLL